MSKRLIMSLLFSTIVSIFFYFGMPPANKGGPATVLINLPSGCLLIEPKNEVESMSGVVAVVKVKPGPVDFVFDCEGNSVTVSHEVKEGEQTWKPAIP